jgi:alpha-beta hydrolase superfamily lysophospholipase
VTADDLYSEGIRIAQTIRGLDGPNVSPRCHTCLYTHGRRVERSLVLLHEFPNCPQQMDELGRLFFERGWNVFIPRYPRHGYKDHADGSIAELRAEHYMAVANRAAEAGAGLGRRLTVARVGLGGILAGVLARERRDIDRAVLVRPALGLRRLPGSPLVLARAYAALLRLSLRPRPEPPSRPITTGPRTQSFV